MKKNDPVKNVIVVSDTHCGCQLGLCPETVKLDGGGNYHASSLQLKVLAWWNEFWNVWVPMVTHGEPYIIVVNGDAMDGNHHDAVTQITHNLADQQRIAEQILKPVIEKAEKYYHIRGTEAHVGKSGQNEEALARALGAVPDESGNCARWDLWLNLAGRRIHFTHHIGTTSSASYESTAVHKELVEAYVEAGRWGYEPPDIVVRSHRHRGYKIEIATKNGLGIAIITPGWQLKTPFVYKLLSGRSGTPQIGGILIRLGDEDGLYTRTFTKELSRPKEEII
ncbi:MAG: hypothetical protein PHW12_01625 [Smithella sp.]|nr:hypothetical protein [Smithella sp.]